MISQLDLESLLEQKKREVKPYFNAEGLVLPWEFNSLVTIEQLKQVELETRGELKNV